MTDAEKLQKLIKLAWANGWRLKEVGRFEVGWQNFSNLPSYTQIDFIQEAEEEGRIEFILFDHEFIKALCKGKGRIAWNYYMPFEIIQQFDLLSWEDTIKKLAISENRINYLYEVFCDIK